MSIFPSEKRQEFSLLSHVIRPIPEYAEARVVSEATIYRIILIMCKALGDYI